MTLLLVCDRTAYYRLAGLVTQMTVLRPLLMFVAALLWIYNAYIPGNVSVHRRLKRNFVLKSGSVQIHSFRPKEVSQSEIKISIIFFSLGLLVWPSLHFYTKMSILNVNLRFKYLTI